MAKKPITPKTTEENETPQETPAVSAGFVCTNSFEIQDGRKVKSYAAGDTFVVPEDWQLLPKDPGDAQNVIKFSVPYELDTDSKEPVISHRTVILPLAIS